MSLVTPTLKEENIVSLNISNKIAETTKPRLKDQTFFSFLVGPNAEVHMNLIHVN